jgi:hypothetical protein
VLSPLSLAGRILSDVGAVVDFVRWAPSRIDRALELAEELTEIGATVAAVAERFDRRFEEMTALGRDLDRRLAELIALGESIRDLGDRFDARGGELVERANRVAETGEELIASLPAFERAVEMATPLEGAIDRFGRFVDLLPGGSARRRAELAAEVASNERRAAQAATGSAGDAAGPANDAAGPANDAAGPANNAAGSAPTRAGATTPTPPEPATAKPRRTGNRQTGKPATR